MDGDFSINNKKLFQRIINKNVRILFIIILAISIGFGVCCVQSDEIDSRDVVYANGGSSSIVMEVSTKRVLYSSNIHQRLPMASTTKIMTALTVLENVCLDEEVIIPKQAVGVEGSSIYLREREKLTVEELLYGLMLRSGNDAATALAIYVGGSVDEFAQLMNSKAKSLGLKNTNFVNPHGLHHNNHYTSGYDLAYISAAAMQNPHFAKIVGTKMISINGVEGKRILYNKNKILQTYSGGNGIKTGFTKRAGRCLVASSMRNNMQIVSVVLNVGAMFEECTRLMDTIHSQYHMIKVCQADQELGKVMVQKGKQDSVGFATQKDIYAPIRKDGTENFQHTFSINNTLEAPITKGKKLGKIAICIDDCLLFSTDVYTIDNIEKKGALDYLKDFFK